MKELFKFHSNHNYLFLVYNQEYLLDQVIWEAYPEELLDISDSGNK